MESLYSRYMTFNGTTSIGMSAILEKEPLIPLPTRRAIAHNVGGYSGVIYNMLDEYQPIPVQVSLLVKEATYFDRLRNWLHGRGRLKFNAFPNREWDAVVKTAKPSDVASSDGGTVRFLGDVWRRYLVNFVLDPLAYVLPDVSTTYYFSSQSTQTITNSGNANSFPLLEVSGKNTCILSLRNGGETQRITINYPTSTFTKYIIDSNPYSLTAVDVNGVSVSQYITGEPFIIRPGTSQLVLESGASNLYNITLKPRWRIL